MARLKAFRTYLPLVLFVILVSSREARAQAWSDNGFTKNLGQWPDSILFRGSIDRTTMWLTRNGIYYQYTEPATVERATSVSGNTLFTGLKKFEDFSSQSYPLLNSSETILIKAEYSGANPGVEVVGLGELPNRRNYLLGSDSRKWIAGVPSYSTVEMKGLYSGVDAVFRIIEGSIECTYRGGLPEDIARINVKYIGGDLIRTGTDGSVVLSTSIGERTFNGVLPADGSVPKVSAATPLTGMMPTHSFGYSTFLGGSGSDVGLAIAVDRYGYVYVAGGTTSVNFPTVNPYDGTLSASSDIFVTKLASGTYYAAYSTYLGGGGAEYPEDMAVDYNGSAYVTGWTASSDFPTQVPLDGELGGTYDAFVTKLSPAGNTLDYSSYLGGGGDDKGYAIALDSSGSAYLTGWTQSTDFPTQSAFDASFGGSRDAFVVKLLPSGEGLLYSTFLGGAFHNGGFGIAVDRSGCAYVTGSTEYFDFPMPNAYDSITDGNDAFAVKFSAAGSSLVYATYLGGTGMEDGIDIEVDSIGSAYVTGWTWSSNFPTVHAFDSVNANNQRAIFAANLTADGRELKYSTYFGGTGSDDLWNGVLDSSGCLYLVGRTASADFPMYNPWDRSSCQ